VAANASPDDLGDLSDPAVGADVSVDLDAVVLAWPLALESLKAPLRATIQDAQPIRIESGTIVFGVPRRRLDAINQRFRAEASAIKEAFAQQLGVTPRFILSPHDFDAHDAFRPTSGSRETVSEIPNEPPVDDVEEHVDLSELTNAPASDVPDSGTLLADAFGGEVVEERERD
jgi:hypothetical protein